MGEKKQAVVELALPFALEHRGYAAREYIVGWDSRKATEYLRALCAEIEANAGEFDDCTWGAALQRMRRPRSSGPWAGPCAKPCMWRPVCP